MTADQVIGALALEPHPEGGYFRETFRDDATDSDGRSVSTAIYFLLKGGEVSRWHRVDATETWHWYAGAPLRLSIAGAGDDLRLDIAMGRDLLAGQRPQAIVPPHAWQQACSLGAETEWTLVGCTVAPGFEFAGFEMAPIGFEPANQA